MKPPLLIVTCIVLLSTASIGFSQVPESAVERAKRHEGMIVHPYLDTAGNVTLGIGRMVPDEAGFKALKLFRKSDGMEATEVEKKNEWTKVKALLPGKLPEYYDQNTTLKVDVALIRTWLTEDIETTIKQLKTEFPDYASYPPSAQGGLIEMGFNLGVPGLIRKFPTFCGAVKSKDWKKAAMECKRKSPISDCRNEETKRLFQLAVTGD